MEEVLPRLALVFCALALLALGVKGFGGIFNMRRKTSSSLGDLDIVPQPLTRVRPKPYTLTFGPDALNKNPALTLKALAVISAASDADTAVSRLLGSFALGTAEPVLDYYASLTADGPKTAILQVFAASALNPGRLVIFNAVMKRFKSAYDPRNKVAHWLWGYCAEVPDAILLMDPKDFLKWQGRLDGINLEADRHMLAGGAIAPDFLEKTEAAKDDLSQYMMVYKDRDFEQMRADLATVGGYLHAFYNITRWDRVRPAEGDRLAQQLSQRLGL